MPAWIEQHVRELIVAHLLENVLSRTQISRKFGVAEQAVDRIAKHAKIRRQGARVTESPEVLAVGAWVQDGPCGLKRWDPDAHPAQQQMEAS